MILRYFRLKVLLVFLSCFQVHAINFQDDDKVVLLGNTFIERAQQYGYFETALTLSSGKKNLHFRNLAWSGDSVFGHARSYFGPPAEGFSRLKADLENFKPNVVIICYGAGAAFDGNEGLNDFISGYNMLLDMIEAAAKPREIILLSPPPAETLAAPMPNMDAHNEMLAIYAKAIGELANKKGHGFADIFSTLKGTINGLTDNGIHFSEKGYRTITPQFIKALALRPLPQDTMSNKKSETLRELIISKNKLFFHQWRPANETYLRLFRKHEQGKNVKELPMFDPLIAEREKEIEVLRTEILSNK